MTAVTVRVQRWSRRGRQDRWAYVIEEPGVPIFVSAYRYSSKEAAQKAGEKEVAVGDRI